MHLFLFEDSLPEKLLMIAIGCQKTAVLLQPNACSSFQAIAPVDVFFPKHLWMCFFQNLKACHPQ